jgi:hypothetical protein
MEPNLRWGNFSNGQVPRANLVEYQPGKFLQADAARNLRALAAEFRARWGDELYADWYQDLYRSLSRQREMWNNRGSGFPWPDSVAYPGNSIHGWARSADLTGYGARGSARHNWLIDNAPRFGWTWDYGRELNEGWHFDYVGPITTTAGDGLEPFPPKPERKVNPVIAVFFSYRSGVGQFLVYVSATRVSVTQELSTASPANRTAAVNTALAIAKAAGLPYASESEIPVIDDTANGSWYFRNQIAYAATGMPSTYTLSASTPYQVTFAGASGGLTAEQNGALMALPAAIADLPTNGEMGQALTSTVALVNEHADENKDAIIAAIPSGSGGSASTYSLNLNIDQVPGTATGTATPQ